jgi:hypothetical protein
MLLCIPLHNSGALPPVYELFKRPSYNVRIKFHENMSISLKFKGGVRVHARTHAQNDGLINVSCFILRKESN